MLTIFPFFPRRTSGSRVARSAAPFPIWCKRRWAWLQETAVRQRQSGGREGQPARVVSGGRRRGGGHLRFIRGVFVTQGKMRPEYHKTTNTFKWSTDAPFIYINVCYCNCVLCCAFRKPPRSQSWRRRSSISNPWRSVKRAWRRRTVSPRRPKKLKQRPKERLDEKVSHFDSFSADFLMHGYEVKWTSITEILCS